MSKLPIYRCLRCIVFCLLILSGSEVRAQYPLKIELADRDSIFLHQLKLQTNFKNSADRERYINRVPFILQSKGYMAASIDSFSVDSSFAYLKLYIGQSFKLARLSSSQATKDVLTNLNWDEEKFSGHPLNFSEYEQLRDQLLEDFENKGYPFAKIFLDSVSISENNQLFATLKIDPGPLYKIDSLRVYGNAKISNEFLQRYLEIPAGSIYHKQKLQRISTRIRELAYVQEQQPWTLTMLGTGSVVNLYLQPKKSNQINVLVGFFPANNQTGTNKLLVTGEAEINLKNALGNGESLGVNWQQLQVKSPRLNLSFQEPYIFKSPFGFNATFDLFKKDSSYLNLNMLAGIQYNATAIQSGTVFIQSLRTNVLMIDTIQVQQSKQLPVEADVSSVNLGVKYDLNTTNYRFNPVKGNVLSLTGSAGTRKIRKNDAILKLKDPNDPSFNYASLYDSVKLNTYQFRLRLSAAHFFRITRISTIKASLDAGLFQSPSIFRNELFQIGGYKLLRGFDEESIFASQFAVASVEYRYLVGINSYFFTFTDYGLIKNKQQKTDFSNSFIGAGLGLAFETKAGIFNISFAAGKRNDVKFDLRQSKIHLGYVNFF